jgi:hypothetical protein
VTEGKLTVPGVPQRCSTIFLSVKALIEGERPHVEIDRPVLVHDRHAYGCTPVIWPDMVMTFLFERGFAR